MERQDLIPSQRESRYGSLEAGNRRSGNNGEDKDEPSVSKPSSLSHKLVLAFPVFLLVLLMGKVVWTSRKRTESSGLFSSSCVWTTIRCIPSMDGGHADSSCWIRPSDYEACLQSIPLDTNHFVQTIEALDATFQQWYPFYNQGRSSEIRTPSNRSSIDTNTGPYEIYAAPLDLHTALQNVRDEAKLYGVTVASIWQVSEIFNWLRDAHLNAVKGTLGNLTSDFWSGWYRMDVFPEESWQAMMTSNENEVKDLTHLKTVFYYDSNEVDDTLDDVEALRLNIERYNQDGHLLETRRVLRIDNLSTGDFILRFAKHVPLRNLALRSVGPRVNALIGRYFPTKKARTALFSLYRPERILPRHVFPYDSFVVEYADDTSETFYVGVAVPSEDLKQVMRQRHIDNPRMSSVKVLPIDLQAVTYQVNQPSCLYRNFQQGLSKAGHSSRQVGLDQKRRSLNNNAVTEKDEAQREIVLEEACEICYDGWFTKAYNCSKGFQPPYEEDGPLEMAYKVMDDFLVFKLDSFDAPPDIIFPMWREMNRAASEEGIRKLMIDLSDNGGGEVPLGLNLAQLMYPEVSCEMFDNKYDMLYNRPMAVWADSVAPLINKVETLWSQLSEKDMAKLARHVSRSHRRNILRLVRSMCAFDADRETNHCGTIEDIESQCPLLASAESFHSKPNGASFANFVETYLNTTKSSNPWTVLSEFDVHVGVGRRSVIRGGEATNLTDFLAHEPDFPIWWDCPPLDEVNVFSEYILVGNGNAGSTTNTFQTTVEQIWKHRRISGAHRPLTTVSYGGLGEQTPMSQFAGGTLDSRVNTEVAYAGTAGLSVMNIIFSGLLLTHEETLLTNAQKQLQQSLPRVPYYLSHFSQLPAVEIYNKFIWKGGETAPLEFIYFPPDFHIRDVYAGSIFEEGQVFEPLYRQAARFFQGL